MTPDERRGLIRRVPLFARLDDAACDELGACVAWRRLDADAVLFRAGDPGDTMVFVAAGTLSVRLPQGGGPDRAIAEAGVGEILGEMACMDPAPRSATIVATTRAVVCELDRARLAQLRTTSPAVASLIVGAVLRDVTRRLREVDRKIDEELAPKKKPDAASAPKDASPGTPSKAGFKGFLERLTGKS